MFHHFIAAKRREDSTCEVIGSTFRLFQMLRVRHSTRNSPDVDGTFPQVERWRNWARESLVRHVTLNINRIHWSTWCAGFWVASVFMAYVMS